jgi:excisionase family DNA binding protein
MSDLSHAIPGVEGPHALPTHRALSPWMTPEETATYIGIALGTLRNWTSARFIPFAKKGRVVRYHRATIDKWLLRGACPGRMTLANL